MNRLRQKLTSQTGASITYALLLFLVCAVVSSIVLAAATAASGRMSKAAESDKRYYAVTSAAELLKDYFDDVKAVMQTKQEGESATPSEVSGYPKIYKGGSEVLPASGELENFYLLDSAIRLFTENLTPIGFPKKLEVKVGSDKNADVQVDFVFNNTVGEESGRLIYAISSYDPDNSSDIYTLYVVFDADILQTVDTKTKDTYDTEEKKIVPVVTTTTTTEMTWKLTSIGTTDPLI